MKFPYKKLSSGISRPIIPIEVVYREKALGYYALIDSGADINVFPAEIADLLGIDIKKGKRGEISGITQGEVQVYYTHPIIINVGGWKYKTSAAFMPTLSKNGYGLLGQNGFFNLFKVKFDHSKQEIELQEFSKK
ncbi:retroviral-like aspartic protease family protein [Candidatus Azambacteria bacterium]|nr:retroviral-like aspartic protease family protein [Candidatus Azambacteria bacterium]